MLIVIRTDQSIYFDFFCNCKFSQSFILGYLLSLFSKKMDEDISTEVSTRQLKCELNVLRNPDGSAMFSQGKPAGCRPIK